jgi:tRNA/rRNA methyltransferase
MKADKNRKLGKLNPRKEERRKRIFIVLVRPEKAENVGLVARSMKNTGFENLRLVKSSPISERSYQIAVHAKGILEKAPLYSTLKEATADLDLVLAATSKKRKNFPSFSLDEAVEKILSFPVMTRIGLLFGNERTGLTSEELKSSNFRFSIPQASRQPSYNLASAVLLTLFPLFRHDFQAQKLPRERLLSRKEQEECIQLIVDKLKKKRFIHSTNKEHVTEMVYDFLGRSTLTEKDKKLLLAIFSKI